MISLTMLGLRLRWFHFQGHLAPILRLNDRTEDRAGNLLDSIESVLFLPISVVGLISASYLLRRI